MVQEPDVLLQDFHPSEHLIWYTVPLQDPDKGIQVTQVVGEYRTGRDIPGVHDCLIDPGSFIGFRRSIHDREASSGVDRRQRYILTVREPERVHEVQYRLSTPVSQGQGLCLISWMGGEESLQMLVRSSVELEDVLPWIPDDEYFH